MWTPKGSRSGPNAIRDTPNSFCVVAGGPEHIMLRTAAKPSDIHLALLMLWLSG
jgi:hypothetical protein